MRILKFGGTSVGDARRLQQVVALVREAATQDRLVVVSSAMAGVTDQLASAVRAARLGDEHAARLAAAIRDEHLACLHQLCGMDGGDPAVQFIARLLDELDQLLGGVALLGECTPSTQDRILAMGERLACQLLAAALRPSGHDAEVVDGSELIRTDSSFGEAAVKTAETEQLIVARLGPGGCSVPVVTGFIGADDRGRTTTLGRGGSDYSATLIGSALAADRVEIWTDVSGVHSAPPRLVPGARPLPALSYEEAAELAFFGAKVLHPKTMEPVTRRGIPIHIRNTLDPGAEGSVIGTSSAQDTPVAAVTAVEDVTSFTLASAASDVGGRRWQDLYDALVHLPTEPLLVSQASARHSLLLAVPARCADAAEEALNRSRTRDREHDDGVVRRDDARTLIAVVGRGIHERPWLTAEMLSILGRHRIPVQAVSAGASAHSVAFLVDALHACAAVVALHASLVSGRSLEWCDAPTQPAARPRGSLAASPNV